MKIHLIRIGLVVLLPFVIIVNLNAQTQSNNKRASLGGGVKIVTSEMVMHVLPYDEYFHEIPVGVLSFQ